MNKQIAALLVGVALTLVATHTVSAAGTSGAQFLKMGAGARATAMGDAIVSAAFDVTATYWNPAALTQIQSPELAVMQNSGLVETQYQYLAAAMPYRDSAIGVSLYRLDYGTINRYTAADTQDGTFNAGSLAGSVSMGTKINENLMGGVSVKYIQESIESESATSFAGDFGVLYKMNRINLGAAIQNVGPGMKMVQDSTPLPMMVRLGASTRFMEDKMLVSIDASKPNDNNISLHSGVEYQLVPMVALRGGYKLTPSASADLGGLTGLSGGLGIMVNRFTFDYAVSPFGDLGLSHRISLLVRFGSQN